MKILVTLTLDAWNACAEHGVTTARALADRGHEVAVLAEPGGAPADRARRAGLQVVEEFDLKTLRAGLLPMILRLRRYLTREGFDLVNAHRAEGQALVALASRGLSWRPLLVRTRGDSRPPRAGWPARLLNRRWTEGVATAGKYMESWYRDGLGVPWERVRTIYPGVDTGRLRPPGSGPRLRERLGVSSAAPLIGMVARLSPVKGHRDLIAALANLSDGAVAPHLIVVGEEAQLTFADLDREARRAGIRERVHLLGVVPDVREVMAALDVGVVASVGSEGICRVALEYMAMGRPVVATRVGVLPEIVVDGETGLLVPPGKPEAMARALAEVLGAERRGAMGEAARRRAEEVFSLAVLGERTEEFFVDVVDWHRSLKSTGR